VTGLDQTHDEMVQKLNRETAENEARMELALDSVDSEALQIEEDAEEIRAAELVDQFKMEMGVGTPTKSSDSASEEGSIDLPDELEESEPQKTIGKQQRTQSE